MTICRRMGQVSDGKVVYVVLAGYAYEGYELVGVRSTRDKAQALADSRPFSSADSYDVFACTIDSDDKLIDIDRLPVPEAVRPGAE
jgi:hypothetical protein